MRNQVARYMNTVNRNSVHKSSKQLLLEDDKHWIDEGIQERQEQLKEDESHEIRDRD